MNGMFNIFEDSDKALLDRLNTEMDKIQTKLERMDPMDAEYPSLLARLQQLIQARNEVTREKKDKVVAALDWTKLISAGIGLVSIAMILNYEKTEIVNSKALGIATKLLGR